MKVRTNHAKENKELRARLAEAEELLAAIKSGAVDAFVTDDQQVFTLKGADHAYRVLVETINEGAATLTFDGTVMYCNSHLSSMLDLPIEKIIGSSVFDLVGPGELPRLKSILRQCETSTARAEFRLKKNGDAPVPVLISCNSLKLADTALCMVITDLTEQKKTEQELEKHRKHLEDLVEERTEESRKSKELLQAIMDNIPDAIFLKDAESRIVMANAATLKIIGKSLDEVIGRDDSEHYADLEVGRVIKENDRRVMESGVMEAIEEVGLTPDGYRTFLSTKLPWRDAEGRVIGLLGIARDITDHKLAEKALRESEERYRSLFEGSLDAVFAVDLKGRFLVANPAAERISGYAVPEFLKMSFDQMCAPDCFERAMTAFDEVMAGSPRKIETAMIHKNGRRVELLVTGSPMSENGIVNGVFCIASDITERKRAEEVVRQSRKTFSELIERAPFGIYVVDAQFRIAHMNASSQNGAFQNVRPVIGRSFDEAMHILWPDAVAEEIISHFRHTLDTGESYYSPQFINPRHDEKIVESYEWELHRMTLPDGQFGVICYYFDSTKLRNAERELRESEGRFRLALKNSPVLVAMQDSNLVYQWAYNTRTQRPEDIIGKTDADLFAPEDVPAILEAKRKVLRTGEEVRKKQWLTSNGQRVYLDCYYEPLKDSSGRIIGVGIAAVNLTDQKLAEEALIQARNILSDAQKIAHLGSFEYIAATRTTIWSEEEYLIYGLDLAGPSPEYDALLARFIHPDDRELLHEEFTKAIQTGSVYELEHRIVRPDGSVRWVYDRAHPYFDKKGGLLKYLGTTLDVTERKRAEEELGKLNRTLKALSDSSQAMTRADNEENYLNEICRLVIKDCGHAMVWIGYAEQDEVKTVRPVAQAGFEEGYLTTVNISWADTERGRGPTGTAIRTGKVSICRNMLTDPIFTPWRQEAIKRGYASSIVFPLIMDGKAFGAITIYSREPDPFSEKEVQLLSELADDLSYGIKALRLRADQARVGAILKRDKETLEKLIQERSKELIEVHLELERAKRLSDIGQLAATVAHELRNPLAAIAMTATNIQRKSKEAELFERHFESIQKKIMESDQIINNLLFYSRLRTPDFKNVGIYSILGDCVELAEERAKGKIVFKRQFDAIRNISIEADHLQLQETFSNLLNNACDAMLDGYGIIEIIAEHNADSVRLCIKDNGAGIPKENLERIFNPFFSTKAKGTGLGLTVCYQIAKMHGGSIGFKSEQGKGTVVEVVLPNKQTNKQTKEAGLNG